MTARKYSSRSQQTSLTSTVTSGATIFPVTNAATLIPSGAISGGNVFTIVIDPDTAIEEIVDVTSYSVGNNNLTVTRGVDGSSAQDHSAGALVRHMVIGRDLREANTHTEASSSYNDGTAAHTLHGLGSGDGVVVGTDATQTLTNKTFTNPIINGGEFGASIVFEGATPDAFETTLAITDPTADRTITFTDATGTVVLRDATETLTNKTITTGTLGSNLAAGGFKITGLGTPTTGTDAVTKTYADANVAAAATSAASAATSASSAATSASSAATSAGTATTQATAASTSASSAATSASSAATSASSSLATYNTYKTYYLGAFASAPTLDNQGNALITGATYWNTTSSLMFAWSGSTWNQISTTAGAYTAPTLGSTVLTSGATVTTVDGLTLTTPVIGNIKHGYSTQAGSGTALVLTASSNYKQYITGTVAQTITLPVATTMTLGLGFFIVNNSTATVTVNSSGGNLVISIPTGFASGITNILTSGTTAASWSVGFFEFDSITGSGAVVAAVSPSLTTPSIGVATGTSFNSITGLSSTTPAADGTAAVGTGTTAARGDHVHPTDTSRAPLASPSFTGTVASAGDITSTLAGAFTSLKDFQMLTLMDAI